MIKNLRKNKGITLIALVITIIVLLILAGVTINAIVGNESAMEKAKEARVENEKGNELDTIKLAVTDAMVKETDGTIHLDKLNESLTGLVKGEATGDSPWIVTGNTGYKYRITAYGEVTLASTVDIVRNNEIVTDKKVKVESTEIGHTVQLTAEPTPDVTLTSSSWTSSNTSVATINSSTGEVTIVAEGQTTITLTAVTSIGNLTKTCTIKVGDSISYTTSLNGVTLSNWKVFYVDGDYTYIILADYLPNSAVSSTLRTTYNLENGTGDYNIHSTTNRKDLIDAMTTKSNWSSLLKGTLNGKAIDYSSSQDKNIKAMGSPTLDLYVASWNEKYPSNKIYIAQTENAMRDGYNGYYLSATNDPPKTSEYNADMSTTVGNSNVLYFPYKVNYNGCIGYYIASPGAYSIESVNYSAFTGEILSVWYDRRSPCALRPVICLPSSLFE